MKIAISAQGTGPDSPLDPRFGRASGFVLFDTESNTYDYLDNSAQVDLAQGAGIQTAQVVADSGALLLITGRVGPKAEAALKQAGVNVFFSEQETVAQALQEYQASGQGGRASAPAGQGAGQGGGRAAPQGGRGMGGGGRGMGGGQGGGQGGGCRRTGGSGRGMGGGGGRGMGGGGKGNA